ncbi:MAG TPA: 16S rRNA (adenine(1518)-N(6)/adenine(1519)-N(6))-dimethyltransferase RsmA [Actinomycetota bacterium]|nr:16S rRNA (adenine(1518)-N(6)/adenine(1519)-N(6))-dimethyltransferase RsmA [Actinomycetota bacterium]
MGGSSTSATRPSSASPRSGRASARSGSPGDRGLGRGALRSLAERHGIRPRKSLGQHFLADPNLARAIVADARIREGDRVLEVGAGLGSLTVALAEAGCELLAVEFDRALLPALREVLAPHPGVRLEVLDAMRVDWEHLLPGRGWAMVSNLPYNVSVPLLVGMLETVPAIDRYLVMVQREVGERLVAGPGEEAYGAVSLHVAYRARAEVVRRVPASVFWPAPSVGSVLVRLTPHDPPVDVDPVGLFRVVDEGFAERRKTMGNAVRRLGCQIGDAIRILRGSGIDPAERAERLDLDDFARLTRSLVAEGWRP